MDLREQIRSAIGGALAAQEGSDGAADAVMEVLEKQRPAAWCATDETGTVVEALGMNQSRRFDTALYLAPGAQPAPSVPEGVSFIDTSQLAGVVSTEIVHSYPPPSGWLRAIDEALVVTHLGVANASDTYEQAKAKLDSLIGFHVDVATDPAVNGGWKLVPVEPTKKMVKTCAYMLEYGGNSPQRIWEVMLAAAPEVKP